MNTWERFNEHHYQIKKFFTVLNLEDITDKDYAHAQTVFEEFKLKNLGDYRDLFMFKVIHYCLQVYLKTLETSVLKYINMTLLIFCLHPD